MLYVYIYYIYDIYSLYYSIGWPQANGLHFGPLQGQKRHPEKCQIWPFWGAFLSLFTQFN